MSHAVTALIALTTFAIAFVAPSGSRVPGSEPQDPVRESAQKPVGPRFVLDAGQHELSKVVRDAAAFLDWNIMFQESELGAPGRQSIELQKPLALDRAKCEVALSQFLYMKGLALVPRDLALGTYELIDMNSQRRGEISASAFRMSPQEVLECRERYVQVATTVRLNHINAQAAVICTRPFYTSAGTGGSGLMLGCFGDERMIMLQGFAPQVAQAIELFAAADVAPDGWLPATDRLTALEARVESLEKAARDR